VGVDVVVGVVAVLAFADDVGQFSKCEEVSLFGKKNAVLERKPLAVVDFFPDGLDTIVKAMKVHA
jgi:hypothetical protein